MAHQYGTVTLTKPRIQVLHGLDANLPNSLRDREFPKSNAAIKSGMLISRKWDGASKYEWVKGIDGNAGATLFFAYQSQTDFDVVECGMITGLSCAGDFEIQTPYFKTGETYNDGTLLTYDGATGDLKPAASTDIIVARVSGGLRGYIQLNPLDAAALAGSKLNQVSDSSAATDVRVIQVVTCFSGAAMP